MLVSQIVPILKATVPRTVSPVGAEDSEELVQDATVMAALAIESCELRGVPLIASSIAYYSTQRLRGGRRSYGSTRTDAMCPAAHLDKRASSVSLDEPVPGEHGEGLALHDLIAGRAADPAQEAAAKIDWSELVIRLNERELKILDCIAQGKRFLRLAEKWGISAPRLTQLKSALAAKLRAQWGEHALHDALAAPAWRDCLAATRERMACRHDRVRPATSQPEKLSGRRLAA